MTKLEQLIKELCPNGVKYVAIKDYFTRLKGTPITAGKMKEIDSPDGEIRIFAGGKTVINAHEKDIPNANITRVPAVLVQSRGVIDFIYYEKPFTFKNEMWAYTAENKITVKYLYYFYRIIRSISEIRLLEWALSLRFHFMLQRTSKFLYRLWRYRLKLSRYLTNTVQA